jgi:hypothetical protein
MRGRNVSAQVNEKWNAAAQDTDQKKIAVGVIRADLCAKFFDAGLKRFFVYQNFSKDIVVMLHGIRFFVE